MARGTKAKYMLLLVVLLVALILPLLLTNQFYIHVMVITLLYAFMATAWNILGGFTAQFSLGHSAFVGIGAYTSTLLFLRTGISPWIGMLLASALCAILGMVIFGVTFRLRGPYFALSSIALTWVIKDIIESTNNFLGLPVGGARGVMVPLVEPGWASLQFLDKRYYYYIILIMLAVALAITHSIRNTRFGYWLLALRDDVEAAESLGVPTQRYAVIAGVISAVLTAWAGTFYVQFLLFAHPGWIFSEDLSVLMALMAIAGGRGTVYGPLLGAMILTPISEVTRVMLQGKGAGLPLVVYGMILILVMRYMPHGLMPIITEWLKQRTGKVHPILAAGGETRGGTA